MSESFMTTDQRLRAQQALIHLKEAESEYKAERWGPMHAPLKQAQRELEEMLEA